MRILSRLPGRCGVADHLSRCGAGLLLLALAWPVDLQARDVSVRGSQTKTFGRIALEFDGPTKVQARTDNNVLVIRFSEPARIRQERLLAELPGYASVVRLDPDGTGLRVGLTGPMRANILEAGERVFVDLLPPSWVGLPPALPPEVVAELAQRARNAEASLRARAVPRTEAARTVTLSQAEQPNLTRLVFDAPPGTSKRLTEEGGEVRAVFDGPLTFDLGGSKPRLAPGLKSFSPMTTEKGLVVTVSAKPGYVATGFAEGDTLVIDLAKARAPLPARQPAEAAAQLASPTRPMPVSASPTNEPRPVPPAPTAIATKPAIATAQATIEARPASTVSPAPVRSGPLVPVVQSTDEALRIAFPFARPTAAASFERGGRLVVIFDTSDRIDVPTLPADWAAKLQIEESVTDKGMAVLRFALAEPGTARLVPDGAGWRLTVGERYDLPPDPLNVTRVADGTGNGEVRVAVPALSAAHWIRGSEGGERLAVVTAFGRSTSMPKGQNFVEFALPATIHGLVVAARADDVHVGLADGVVTISRSNGLALSPRDGALAVAGTPGPAPVLLARDQWAEDKVAPVLPRYRELLAAAAEAPASARTEARIRLARFLVANGLNAEASSALAVARADDPAASRRREVQLLSGIAAVRAGRDQDARAFLTADVLAQDPEARLWTAMIDEGQRRAAQANTAFTATSAIAALYPEELAGAMRFAALRAALEVDDRPAAEQALAELEGPLGEAVHADERHLARAKLDEVGGATEKAAAAYENLAGAADRRVAADATLRALALATRTGALKAEESIPRLEALTLAWRGDDLEARAIIELSRAYASSARWHEAFSLNRTASQHFPDHPATRALHDESARNFEKLFIDGGTAIASSVDALALYSDFKDLTPAGRRGDELIRNLAERLVDLDLLDQATDLLQHQVDNRLTGAARATVAARLASLQLMNGKPALAGGALSRTRFVDLPPEVRRLRLLLQARAASDLTRVDHALELLEDEPGSDVDRLRAGILWDAKRWREAGEGFEKLAGTRWLGREPLADRDRKDVLRALAAYALAEEQLGRDRITSKFGTKMADSPDAATFDVVTRPDTTRTSEFRTILRDLARADALKELLADFSTRFPDAPLGRPAGSATTRVAPTQTAARG